MNEEYRVVADLLKNGKSGVNESILNALREVVETVLKLEMNQELTISTLNEIRLALGFCGRISRKIRDSSGGAYYEAINFILKEAY
jgi:hypothetical protein